MPNLLPPALRPYAKAVYPFVATLVGVVVQWIITGEFNELELVTAITGIVTTSLAFLVGNAPPG